MPSRIKFVIIMSLYWPFSNWKRPQKFYLSAYLCKTHSIADLVKDITTRRRIPKSSVIAERKSPDRL